MFGKTQGIGLSVGFIIFIASSMAAVDDCQEMQYWNGTSCVQCSECPRGFGLKTKCQSKKDTECLPCWPGYDYSNTTGLESCILCDKYSNCVPGNSKIIKNCTIFSGPVCDGCEDGNYLDPEVGPNGGCVECSPSCSILQVETRPCTTDHDRRCRAKTTVTFPDLGNSSTDPGKEIPNSTVHSEKVDPEGPALAAGGTSNTSSRIPLVENGWLWGGVIVGIVTVAIAIAVVIKKGRKSRNRRKRDATAGEDRLKMQQRRPLMSSAKPGLDDPISDLQVDGRRFITQKLNGKYHDSYFYWQTTAEKLGLRAECESWKNAENPAEKFLKAYGEKEGSTIRKLVEVLRDPEVNLTQIASDIENKFSPPQEQGEQEDVDETEV